MHQDRGTGRAAAIGADIIEMATGCLGKQRRNVTGGAEIQGTGAKRLQQRRSGREFRPADSDPLVGKPRFQRPAALGERQHAILLPADAKLRCCCGTRRLDGRKHGYSGGRTKETEGLTA